MTTARHTREPKHTAADAPTASRWAPRAPKVGAVALAALSLVAFASSPALAGNKGGGGSTTTANSVWISSIDGSPLSATSKTVTPSLGDTLTFGSTVSGLAGWEYPMISVSCFQDVNADGTVDMTIGGPDQVYGYVDKPTANYTLGGAISAWTQRGGSAVCQADLDAYGWKSGKQSVRVLQTLGFDALG